MLFHSASGALTSNPVLCVASTSSFFLHIILFQDVSRRIVSSDVILIYSKLEPNDKEMRRRVETFMDIYTDIHRGFVALGLSRILPRFLQFLVRSKVEQLMKYASFTVRDVQYAVLQLGYTKDLFLTKLLRLWLEAKD
jgi:hypothetical protein